MQTCATDPRLMQIPLFIIDLLKISIGAFFGATCAFMYERYRKKDEENNKRKTSLRDAQFAMSSRVNSLLVIYKKYFKQQAINPNRWKEVPPTLNITTPPSIPMSELSFLLDDIDPNLLGELVVARNKFDTVCAIISTRNLKHDEFQLLYEKGEKSERLHIQLTDLTDALYEQLPEAVIFMHSVFKKLEDVMQKHFKKINILYFGPEIEQMIKDLNLPDETLR